MAANWSTSTVEKCAESQTSNVKGLSALLKEVYQYHIDVVAALETKQEELEKKCAKFDRIKNELLNKGRDLQTRYDNLVSDHHKTEDELTAVSAKLCLPCEACRVLRAQLEQQEKSYTVMVAAMKANKNSTQQETSTEYSGRQQKPAKTKTNDDQQKSPAARTSQICTSGTGANTPPRRSPRKHSRPSTGRRSLDRSMDSDSEEISPGGTKGRSLKLLRNSKRTRSKYTEEIIPDAKKRKRFPDQPGHRVTKEEAPNKPVQPPSSWLQHGPTQPHLLDNTVDILAPQTCDHEVDALRTDKQSHLSDVVRSVPETMPCDFGDYLQEESRDGSEDEYSNRKESKKPDYPKVGVDSDVGRPLRRSSTISEPSSPVFGQDMERSHLDNITSQSPSLYDEDEEHDYNIKHNQPRKSFNFVKLRGTLSPKGRKTTKNADFAVMDLTADISETGGTSPSVLTGKIKSFADISGVKGRNSPKALTKQISSPGRIISSDLPSSPRSKPNLKLSEADSPRRSNRKLVQTKLKMSGLGQVRSCTGSPPVITSTPAASNPAPFDPDETVDDVRNSIKSKLQSDFLPFQRRAQDARSRHSGQKSEVKDQDREMLRIAKERSLRQYRLEKAARDPSSSSEISFPEPQYTSTQKVSKSKIDVKQKLRLPGREDIMPCVATGGFKKPITPKRSAQAAERSKRDGPANEELPSLVADHGHVDLDGTIDSNLGTPFAPPYEASAKATFQESVSHFTAGAGEHTDERGTSKSSSKNMALKSKYRNKSDAAYATNSASSSLEITGVQLNVSKAHVDSEDYPEASARSVVFGAKKTGHLPSHGSGQANKENDLNPSSKLSPVGELQESYSDDLEKESIREDIVGNISADYHDDSFDRLPAKPAEPGFAYVDVVRKRDDRKKLEAFACQECDQYFDGLGLPEEEKRERMKSCRHRAKFARPSTPEHYWSIGFPDTQEIEERGYLNTTQAQPSKFRRKRGFRPLFKEDDAHENFDENGS